MALTAVLTQILVPSKNGGRYPAAELLMLGRTFRGQFLVVDQQVGILGRNILNALALLLDGPQQTWSEYIGGRAQPR